MFHTSGCVFIALDSWVTLVSVLWLVELGNAGVVDLLDPVLSTAVDNQVGSVHFERWVEYISRERTQSESALCASVEEAGVSSNVSYTEHSRTMS